MLRLYGLQKCLGMPTTHKLCLTWFRIINAFAIGVRNVSSDTSIHLAFTGSFADVRTSLQATDYLLQMGCDIIVSHTNVLEVHLFFLPAVSLPFMDISMTNTDSCIDL